MRHIARQKLLQRKPATLGNALGNVLENATGNTSGNAFRKHAVSASCMILAMSGAAVWGGQVLGPHVGQFGYALSADGAYLVVGAPASSAAGGEIAVGAVPSSGQGWVHVFADTERVALPLVSHRLVPVEITPAAIQERPQLAQARCFDLHFRVDAPPALGSNQWVASGALFTTTGQFFQHPRGPSNMMMPPLPDSVAMYPALAFDTFCSFHDSYPNNVTESANSPAFAAQSITPTRITADWFFQHYGNPPIEFVVARLTVIGFGSTLNLQGASSYDWQLGVRYPFSLRAAVRRLCHCSIEQWHRAGVWRR